MFYTNFETMEKSTILNAVIDLGNTRGKIGYFKEENLTQDYTGLTVEEIISSLTTEKPTHLLICSVAHSLTELKTYFEAFQNAFFLTHDTKLPIGNSYATPETLGFDRIAAVVGANSLFQKRNNLVIDMGTAIKYDLITEDGIFKGGIISPGMNMRFKALHTFTKKLPFLEASEIPDLIGDSTESCMQSGVINGIIGEINSIIGAYQKDYSNLHVLLTGGDAGFFESQINYPTFAAPKLVLEGLNRILLYNVKNELFT